MTRFSSFTKVFLMVHFTVLVFLLTGAFSAFAVGTDPGDIPDGAHVSGPAIVSALMIVGVEDPMGTFTFTATVSGSCKNLLDRTFDVDVTDLAISGNFAGSTADEVEEVLEGFYLETTEIGNLSECFTEAQLAQIDGLVINTVTTVTLKNDTTFVADVILLPVIDPNQ